MPSTGRVKFAELPNPSTPKSKPKRAKAKPGAPKTASAKLPAKAKAAPKVADPSGSNDITDDLGPTQTKWERVPARYGLSQLVARTVPATNDGAKFLSGARQRHGLAAFVRSATEETNSDDRLMELVELLEEGANPNITVKVPWQPFRTTPLFEACVNGDAPTAAALLEYGAKPSQSVGPQLFSPLYNAALNGHANVVRFLCDSDADVSARTASGMTALYAASQEGHAECVQALLGAKGMTQAIANQALPAELGGATAVYVAAMAGHAEAVHALLEFGVTVDVRTGAAGSTPLQIAVYMGGAQRQKQAVAGRDYLTVAAQLLRFGASIDLPDTAGRTAIDLAPVEWQASLREYALARGAGGGEEESAMSLIVSLNPDAAVLEAAPPLAEPEPDLDDSLVASTWASAEGRSIHHRTTSHAFISYDSWPPNATLFVSYAGRA